MSIQLVLVPWNPRCAGGALAFLSLSALLLTAAAGPSHAAVAFDQDFESGLAPNETTYGSFQVNDTNASLNNGTLMMGHPSNYTRGREYSYYEVELDLSSFEDLELQFDFRANIYRHFDRFNVQASTCPIDPPGDLLSPVSGMTYYSDHTHHPQIGAVYFDSSEKSGTAVFDLSAFDRAPRVCLRFQFGSDYGGSYPGINIDNLVVSGTPLCHAVIAVDDLYSIINDGSVTPLPVLSNDRCTGDQPVTVVQNPGDLLPDRGGAAVTDGTRVFYTPASGFIGFEEFSYTARDAGLEGGDGPPSVDSDEGRVVVNVLEDIAPDAVDDFAQVQQNSYVYVDVLANDTPGNGPGKEIAIVSEPAHGGVSIQNDQTILYDPDYQFFGEDTFEYSLMDENGDVDVATVTVGVFFTRGRLAIDVIPNDAGNNLNLSGGPGSGFRVAILSEGEYLDAPALVDPLTLKLGPRQANIWGSPQIQDVDKDGDDDLLVKFLTQQTGIACGDTSVSLYGRTYASQSIDGSDTINTFHCPRVRKRY